MGLTATPLILEIGVTIFDSVRDTIIDTLAKSPPYNQLVVEAGSLRWEFGCSVQPIPLSFMEEYWQSKRDAINRGFAPVYAREWWWDSVDRSISCYAGMRIVGEGGVVVPPSGPVAW